MVFDPRKYTALYEEKRMEAIREVLLNPKKHSDKIPKVHNSIMHFFNAPSELVGVGSKQVLSNIQAFTQKGDIPDLPASLILDVFNKIENYDMRAEQAYKLRQFDPGQDTFSIVDVSNFFTFDKLPQGGKVEIKHVTGTVAYVKAVRYADGFGWEIEMIEDRRFGEMVQLAEQFRDAYYTRRGKVHYTALVEAAKSASSATAGTPTAYQSGLNDNEKLAKTISLCASTIGDKVKNLGVHPDPAMAPILIYCKPADYDRMVTAVNTRQTSAASSFALQSRQYTVLPSYMLKDKDGNEIAANTAVMVLVGGKIQRADKTPPTTYTAEDITSFSQLQTVRARFACAVAEPKQTAMFALA